MKFNNFVTTIFFLVSCISLANAENKIVYVDMDYLLNKSLVGINVYKKLSENQKSKVSELKKIENDLKKNESEIIQQKNIITKEEFEKKIIKLREKASKYQNKRKETNINLSKKRAQGTADLVLIIQNILSEYSIKEDIAIIFQKKNIVIGKSNLEITSDILNILNDKHKTMKVK
jgi:outer membrane protein